MPYRLGCVDRQDLESLGLPLLSREVGRLGHLAGGGEVGQGHGGGRGRGRMCWLV